jgi:hypothetical protein
VHHVGFIILKYYDKRSAKYEVSSKINKPDWAWFSVENNLV